MPRLANVTSLTICGPPQSARRLGTIGHEITFLIARKVVDNSAKIPFELRKQVGARYWDRTSDLFGVNEARYRCANRAQWGVNPA